MLNTPAASRGTRRPIACGIAKTSLGLALAAGGEAGICAIFLGDEAEPLIEALRSRFFPSEIVEGDDPFRRYAALAVELIEQPGKPRQFPLDVARGTQFQRLVWRALCDVPAGSTASYAEIARMIGRPDAVRAVAGACAANDIAVAIPCHRVRNSNGHISGYRWGVERKRELLKREGGGDAGDGLFLRFS